MLKDVSAKNCKPAEHPISLITANGSTEASEVADVKLPALPDPVQPYVLDHVPAVLSVGTRYVDQGYSFVWPANGKLILVRPDDKVVQLKIEGHVSVLDDTCKACTKKQFQKDKHLKKLFAMPTSQSSSKSKRDDAEDEEQLDELVADDAQQEYVRSRKTENLLAGAASTQHQYTHVPKNPFCRTCQRARMMAPQARKKGGQKRIETEVLGDHIIDAQSSMDGLNHVIGSKDDVQVVYTDNSPELIRAIKDL